MLQLALHGARCSPRLAARPRDRPAAVGDHTLQVPVRLQSDLVPQQIVVLVVVPQGVDGVAFDQVRSDDDPAALSRNGSIPTAARAIITM